ncbi:serine/threonine-protein phosphatase 2A activator [Drosophila eugracilis]|uniref:serine/threonine-protein phosphatase 2A activator n=1 Tax=Drosophila eugracilis TaxID=29029 RepID=UPI0007E6D2C5|nr:serine/threonine-protein phosphatase 2A activator [Drosophila eugracilis]
MSSKLGYDVTDPTVHVLRASSFMQNGPSKQVRSLEDLDRWVRSQAYHDTIAYISNTSRAIQGHRLTRDFPVTEQMRRLCEIFDGLEHLLVEHTPKADESNASMPVGQLRSRSYRTWMQHMFQHVFNKLDDAIHENCKHINELGQYLRRSFGNATSVDFGPANELMFLFFLCGLFRAGILLAKDTVAAALMLFDRYIHLVRRLVITYALPIAKDPMSSVDDYYFLPYLWGAAQLSLDCPFTPMECEQSKVIESYRQDYMILNIIEHLQKTRGGQLSEVAFHLWSILSIPTWPQVYNGLERNYRDHVLCSFRTVEHAIFCELMSFEPVFSPSQLERAYLGQDRQKNEEDMELEPRYAKFHWELSPPVSRYNSMEPESFLGFPQSTTENKSDDSEDDRLCMVRQIANETDPNSTSFFPDRRANTNDSLTSFGNDGP